YLIYLHQHQNSSIEVLREFSEVNEVPIVDRLTLDIIKQLILMNNVNNILEIGTAIVYSYIQFASISDDIHVTKIERNETMI
ncbi:methyltransferase, partial [Staphylococcus aureus]|nr:methyltransferase [Staphylococcus aureus]